MEAFIVIVCIAVAAYGWHKTHPTKAQDEEADVAENDLIFEDVQDRVKRMSQTVLQLNQLEELITSLEICSPEQREYPIRLQWSDPNGKNAAYQFWADGRNNTQMLTDVAYSERHKLRTSLLNQIEELHGTVVTQSVTERELVPEGERYA